MKQLTGLQIKGFWIETVAGWWDSEAKLMIRDLTYHPLRIQTAPKLQVVFLRRNQIMVQLENDQSGQIIATLHDLGPQMVVIVREFPLIQENLGW